MRPNSLAFRLIAVSAIWTAVAILAAGLILTTLYRNTVQQDFDNRLSLYFNALIGQISSAGVEESIAFDIGDPRFGQYLSGWYWQVSQDGLPLGGSRSISLGRLDLPSERGPMGPDGSQTFQMPGPHIDVGPPPTLIVRTAQISIDESPPYEILVTGNESELQGEIAGFRNNVILTLAVLGVGLVLATFVQVRWGLRPLDLVRRGLADLRSGKETRFTGRFPAEIEPLTQELNELLDSNQQIIERSRTHVGNLAHALKTPLSVITNEARAAKGPLADKVAEQAAIMGQQITHHLDRARIAARSRVIGAATKIEPVVSRLARFMRRVYEEKGITLTVQIDDTAVFRGEQQDLEEILGNLTDNACKWATSAVSINAVVSPQDGKDGRIVTFHIDDDGPGVPAAKRDDATRRGQRLDESKPGSGLGLSIVSDLVGLYNGSFRMCDAPAGGLRAEIILPAA